MESCVIEEFMGDRLCRICLQSGDPMHPVFDSIMPHFDAPPVAVIELWRLLSDILISNDEIFPDSICRTCFNDVQNTYIFLIKCEKAVALLKQAKQTILCQEKLNGIKSNFYDVQPTILENRTIAHLNRSYENSEIENEECVDVVSLDSTANPLSMLNTNEEITESGINYESKTYIEKLLVNGSRHCTEDNFKCSKCPYSYMKEVNLQHHINRDEVEQNGEDIVQNYECNGTEEVDYDVEIDTESENNDFVLTPLANINPSASTMKSEPTTSDTVDDDKSQPQTPHFVKYINRDGKVMKVWECGICARNFQHQYTLMRHLPTHTNVRNFVCNECGKAFRQLSTLSQHRAIHSVERPYACETCNKSFNRISTLISHRKTHSDVKPFRCHMCHKGFHQKGNLRNHIYIHTNERPYRCTVCNKGFNQMSNLVCHSQKSHSTEFGSIWTCHRCNMSFSKRTLLRAHELETHHIQGTSVKSNRSKLANARKNATPSALDETKSSESDSGSIEYCKSEISENGILIPAIETEAMKIARTNKEMPFAVLHFFEGTPLLVRIIDHGNQSFLRPTQNEDFISLKSQQSGQPEKVSVPIVAAVYQTLNVSGRPDFKVMPPKNIYKFINQHQTISLNCDSSSNNEIERKDVQTEELPTGNVISLTPPQIPSDLRDVTENLMTPLFEALHSVKDEPNHVDESGSMDFGGSAQGIEDKPRAIAVVEDSNWWKKQTKMDCYEDFDGFSEAFQNIATGSLLAPKKVMESDIMPDQNASILDISEARNPLLCQIQPMSTTTAAISQANGENFYNYNTTMSNNDYGNVSSILHAFRNEGMDTNILKSLFSENPNLLDDINECLSEILP